MKKWIKDRKEFVGKKMIGFNFKAFMIAHNLTVEQLTTLLKYKTVDGTMKMLDRGTVKASKLADLESQFKDLENYRIKKTK